MYNTDNTPEAEQSINTMEASINMKQVANEEKQAPLMHYFSIIDESTESYVLGYN